MVGSSILFRAISNTCISNGAFGVLVVALNREKPLLLQAENLAKLAGVIVEVQVDFFRHSF